MKEKAQKFQQGSAPDAGEYHTLFVEAFIGTHPVRRAGDLCVMHKYIQLVTKIIYNKHR